MNESLRRKHTGEPGNGGKFASEDHPDGDVNLGAPETFVTDDGYEYRRVASGYRAVCIKCGGSGIYDAPTRIRDNDGRPFCIKCGGSGLGRTEFATLEAVTKNAADRAKRHAAVADKREQDRLAWLAKRDLAQKKYRDENPDTAALMDEIIARGSIGEYGDLHIDPNWANAWNFVHDAQLDTDIGPEFAGYLDNIVAEARAKEATRHLDVPVGQKAAVTGVVTRKHVVTNDWGSKLMVETITAEGVHIMFTSTAAWVWDLETDSTVSFTGTVSEHSDYNGIKQTWVKRPTVTKR